MALPSKVIRGFGSLMTGMRITIGELGRTLFRREAVTLQYPHVEPELSPNHRGAIKLIRFDETDSHDCVACLQCEKICPSFCISIDGEKLDGIKKKRASKFHMDFALCSLCGLCIDVCPTDTLEYSKIYEAAGYQRDWNFDLLEEFVANEDRWQAEQRARELKIAEAKKAKAAKTKAAKAAKEAKAAKTAEAAKADKPSKEQQATDIGPPKAGEKAVESGDTK